MDELIGHVILILAILLVVTLGAHFIFAMAWAASIVIAFLVVVFVYLGVWLND